MSLSLFLLLLLKSVLIKNAINLYLLPSVVLHLIVWLLILIALPTSASMLSRYVVKDPMMEGNTNIDKRYIQYFVTNETITNRRGQQRKKRMTEMPDNITLKGVSRTLVGRGVYGRIP